MIHSPECSPASADVREHSKSVLRRQGTKVEPVLSKGAGFWAGGPVLLENSVCWGKVKELPDSTSFVTVFSYGQISFHLGHGQKVVLGSYNRDPAMVSETVSPL